MCCESSRGRGWCLAAEEPGPLVLRCLLQQPWQSAAQDGVWAQDGLLSYLQHCHFESLSQRHIFVLITLPPQWAGMLGSTPGLCPLGCWSQLGPPEP